MANLSHNPARVLTEILKFKLDYYRSPTIRQLDERCGIHSITETRSNLLHLEQTGHIEFHHDERGIRIIKLNYDPSA